MSVELSKTSLRIELTKRFLRSAGRHAEADVDLIQAALDRFPDVYGSPHAHAGMGIRRLAEGVFECRASRAIRLIFLPAKGRALFDFAGSHDEVRDDLRNR